MSDPFFSPSRIPTNHFYNELAEAERNRTSARSRLPLPKQPERPAMPGDECCGLDNQKSGSPSKEARPENQPKPSRVRQSPRLDLAFLVERQLLAKKQILGNHSGPRTETQSNETQNVARQISKKAKCRPDQPKEAHRSNYHRSASAIDNQQAGRTGKPVFSIRRQFLRSTGIRCRFDRA